MVHVPAIVVTTIKAQVEDTITTSLLPQRPVANILFVQQATETVVDLSVQDVLGVQAMLPDSISATSVL